MRRSLALLVLTLVAGCADLSPIDELSAARRRWSEWGPASYDLTVSLSCECITGQPGPVLVRVRNGVVESRTDIATGATLTGGATTFPAVPGLFDIIAARLRDVPDRFEIRYDATSGYPADFSFDPRIGTADDEFGYSVALVAR